ncbi:glutaminase A [Labrenzia sp. CE80]|uniref:glutaminase A n=1 Tax=Labrenzia sp. CE80 TaxID=1788986 RepID=UPI00138956F3|nr:glutaminase A [Labrenzia sp. CE80]
MPSVLARYKSVSKAFVYALAIEYCGHDEVAKAIGVEPSGDSFNSIRLKVDNRPFNPMVNAGAIACTGLIFSKDPDGALERIRQVLGEFAGRELALDEAVYQSESRTGDRNRAIAWLLRNNGVLKGDVDASLDVYFRQCALLTNARDLSIMGATLANNGVNPLTGRRVVTSLTAARVLSIMVSSGMYDYSGEWIYRIGLPAKSGVGGGITAALPAQLGLGTYSPRLDPLGNSVRGLKVCEEISSQFSLHVLQRQGDVRSVIAAKYDLSRVKSHRDRREADQELLMNFGETAQVTELTGAINVISCDFVCRQLMNDTKREIEVLDFRRVSEISKAAAKLLRRLFEDFTACGTRVVLTGLKDNSFCEQTLMNAFGEDLRNELRRFETLTDGVAWAEDQLVFRRGGFTRLSAQIDFAEQPLLAGLSGEQIRGLEDLVHKEECLGGKKIIETGQAADSVFFLTKGMVSVVLDSGVRIATLDAGTCFGEFALISQDEKRSANVVSDSPCQYFKLSVDAVHALNDEAPEVVQIMLKNLAALLAKRLRQANTKIDALTN